MSLYKTKRAKPLIRIGFEESQWHNRQIRALRHNPIKSMLQPAWSVNPFNRLEFALVWMGMWPPPWQGAPHPFFGDTTHQIRRCQVHTREPREICVSPLWEIKSKLN